MKEPDKIRRKLKESEERFALAVAGAQDGIWDWNLLDDSQYMSPRWKEIIGYRDEELPSSFAAFSDNIHPEDKPRVMENLRQYLEGEIDRYHVEFRMRCRDGGFPFHSPVPGQYVLRHQRQPGSKTRLRVHPLMGVNQRFSHTTSICRSHLRSIACGQVKVLGEVRLI